MASRVPSRHVLAVLSALIAALSAAGCVSMPSGGPVRSYPVTQGPDAQGQPYQQVVFEPPGTGWKPTQIVQGFLAASASFGNNWQVAREYMTPQESKAWNPSWSAIVYSNGPNVRAPVYTATVAKPTATAKKQGQQSAKKPASQNIKAMVAITGSVLANLSGSSLSGYGSYAVPSHAAQQGSSGAEQAIDLVKNAAGQWRISSAPPELLLTSDSFKSDYELRNLYFFDPTSRFLVPDPVYVPLQATPADLMNGLVYDLVHPPKDWLSGGATRTAFPTGTTFPGAASIGDVTIAGVTAVVDLGGTIAKASIPVMQQVSAQLVATLSGSGLSGQSVQSVEVEVNGKPWIPPGSQGNPVQRDSKLYNPAGVTPTSKKFYYLDAAGNVMSSNGIRATPVRVLRGNAKYSQVAVSPDGKYLAVIGKNGDLFIGPVGGALIRRSGSGYSTMSWDPNDDLWATMNEQLVMLRGAANAGQPIVVNVLSSAENGSPEAVPFTAVKVAPDGVRVALVIGGNELDFGAISWQAGANPARPTLQIVLSPFNVPPSPNTTFSSVTWYGPDDIITLSGPTPAVTEYPVNGDAATSISAIAGMRSITASAGNTLIAGLAKGQMVGNTSLTGSWVPIVKGVSPAYPG